MSIILDGTSGITYPNSVLQAGGVSAPATVAQGGTGNATATAYAVQCGGTTTTGVHQSIASVGTSGQVLTSNGASALPTFQTISSGGMTLLGTVTAASGNSVSLGSLNLTSYKALFIVVNGVGTNGDFCWVSNNNIQSGGDFYFVTPNIAISGNFWLDLTLGTFGGGGVSLAMDRYKCNVSTSSTIIYFRLNSTTVYNQAGGTFTVYGVA
jgi:hypothetical protein